MALEFLNDAYFAAKVGIGTESPAAKLHVNPTTTDEIAIAINGTQNYSAGEFQRIAAGDANSLDRLAIGFGYDNPTDWAIRYSSYGRHEFYTGNDWGNAANTEKMVITSSGNVGIGTTSPTRTLHVVGGDGGTGTHIAQFEGRSGVVGMYVRGDGNVGIGTTSPQSGGGAASWLSLNGTAAYSGGVVYTIDSTTKAYSYFESDYLKQQAQTGFGQKFIVDGTNTAMTILSGGNVGIGTTSPKVKLNIVGGDVQLDSGQMLSFYTGAVADVQNNGIKGNDTDDSLRFYTGALERVTIKAGNVGIGYSSPSDFTSVGADNLVIGSLSGNNGITVNSSTTGYGALAFADGTGASDQYRGLVQYNHNADSLALFTNATTKMTILSNGNVGIGTTNPLGKLHIENPDTVANQLALSVGQNDNAAAIANFYQLGVQAFSFTTTGTNSGVLLIKSGGSNVVQVSTSGHSYFNGGNVGIGTTNPTAKLDVAGAVQIGENSTTPNVAYGLFGYSGVGLGIYSGASGASQGIGFWLTSGTAYEAGRWLSGGNLGIGTTTPDTKLHVVGTAETRLRVGSSNASSNVVLELRDENTPTGQGTVITYNNATGETYFNNALSTATTDFHFQSGEYGTASDFFTLSNSGGNSILHLKTTSGDSFITYEDSTNELAVASDGDLRLTTPTDQDVFFISSGGNIDMTQAGGTVDMGGNLVVDGTLTSGGDGTINNAFIGEVPTYTSANAQFSHKDRAGIGEYSFLSASDGETFINSKTGKNIHFRVNNSTKAIITSGGNVGIGTTSTSSSSRLTVSSGTSNVVANFKSTDASAYIALADNTSTNDLVNQIGVTGDNMWLSTADVERMRITSGGNVGIGTNNPSYKLTVNNDSANTNNPALYVKNPNSSTAAVIAEFVGDSDSIQIKNIGTGDYAIYNSQQSNGIALFDGTGGVEIKYAGTTTLESDSTGGIKVTGQLSATGDVVAYSSDKRLKENIKPIENAVDKIKQLKGVTFDWNEKSEELGFEPSTKTNDVGVIAQDVEAVFPQLVHLAPFDIGSDEEGKATSKTGEDYKTVNYARLTAVLIEAVKEQQQQIDELKAKLDGITK